MKKRKKIEITPVGGNRNLEDAGLDAYMARCERVDEDLRMMTHTNIFTDVDENPAENFIDGMAGGYNANKPR